MLSTQNNFPKNAFDKTKIWLKIAAKGGLCGSSDPAFTTPQTPRISHRHRTTISASSRLAPLHVHASHPCDVCEAWPVRTWIKLRKSLGDAGRGPFREGDSFGRQLSLTLKHGLLTVQLL